MVTFEPMSLIHVALNVQIHCHIVYGKQQILELLSLLFECTNLLAPSCQSKYKYKHNCKNKYSRVLVIDI